MSGAQSISVSRALPGTLHAVLQLTKPRVTRVVVSTAVCGAVMAPGPVDALSLGWALLGTAIVVGSANALNMYIERYSDAKMERTRGRPLPSGRLAPEVALWFGVVTGLVGIAFLALAANLLTAAIATLAWLSYVLVYTPLKPVTPAAIYVGAVPGALPPLIGWAAMEGQLTTLAFSVSAFLFVWQIPHFLAIAVYRSEEYREAGLPVMPAVCGVAATRRAIVVSAVAAVAVSIVPYWMGFASSSYLVVASLLGVAFVAWAVSGFWIDCAVSWARSLFIASLPYLVLVYGALMVGLV